MIEKIAIWNGRSLHFLRNRQRQCLGARPSSHMLLAMHACLSRHIKLRVYIETFARVFQLDIQERATQERWVLCLSPYNLLSPSGPGLTSLSHCYVRRILTTTHILASFSLLTSSGSDAGVISWSRSIPDFVSIDDSTNTLILCSRTAFHCGRGLHLNTSS